MCVCLLVVVIFILRECVAEKAIVFTTVATFGDFCVSYNIYRTCIFVLSFIFSLDLHEFSRPLVISFQFINQPVILHASCTSLSFYHLPCPIRCPTGLCQNFLYIFIHSVPTGCAAMEYCIYQPLLWL